MKDKMNESFKNHLLGLGILYIWEIHISMSQEKKYDSLKSEEPTQVFPYSQIWRFFMSQDLSFANTKHF